jgi:hypothetical protein
MHKKSWQNRAIRSVEASLVILDLNPVVSEPIRFGTLFGAQAAFHSVVISGLAFGGITLLLDLFGTVATADLLEAKTAVIIIEKTNAVLKKAGLSRLLQINTNIVTDLGITLFVGTPITLIAKQRQDPDRTREDNIKLGSILSIIASFVSVLQGGAIVAGLWHPSIVTDTLAVVAVVSIVVTGSWLKKRLTR